jgi:hypothetical protein
MTSCHISSKTRSLISSRTLQCFSLALVLSWSGGCWSHPESTGTWSGTVSSRTLYVDGKECNAALFKPSEGLEISPQLKSAYLVDSNNHLIDASSFADNASVKINGTAGFKLATDANGRSAESDNGASGTEIGAIAVKSAVLQNGETVELRLATAETPRTHATTLPSP